MSLVSKDEPLKTSMVHVGYLVLKHLDKQEDQRATLASLSSALSSKDVTGYRPLMFGLIFLHTIGAIDFKAPYIYKI